MEAVRHLRQLPDEVRQPKRSQAFWGGEDAKSISLVLPELRHLVDLPTEALPQPNLLLNLWVPVRPKQVLEVPRQP